MGGGGGGGGGGVQNVVWKVYEYGKCNVGGVEEVGVGSIEGSGCGRG